MFEPVSLATYRARTLTPSRHRFSERLALLLNRPPRSAIEHERSISGLHDRLHSDLVCGGASQNGKKTRLRQSVHRPIDDRDEPRRGPQVPNLGRSARSRESSLSFEILGTKTVTLEKAM